MANLTHTARGAWSVLISCVIARHCCRRELAYSSQVSLVGSLEWSHGNDADVVTFQRKPPCGSPLRAPPTDVNLHTLAGAPRATRDDDLQDAIVVGRLQGLDVHV